MSELYRLDTGAGGGPPVVLLHGGFLDHRNLALEYPELVRVLVVSGAGTSEPVFQDSWTTAQLARWNEATAAGDAARWLETFLSFAAGPHRGLDAVAPDVVRRLRTMALTTIGKHTADEPDHLVPVTGTWERAAAIEVPVLAVTGSIDSPDHIGMAERLAKTVRGGRVAVIDDTAHYPNMERPEAFNAVLEKFLRTAGC